MTLEQAKKHVLWSTLTEHQQKFLEKLWELKGDAREAVRMSYNVTHDAVSGKEYGEKRQNLRITPLLQSLKRSTRVKFFWQYMGLRDLSQEEILWELMELLDKTKSERMRYDLLKTICAVKGISLKPPEAEAPAVVPTSLDEFKE